MNYEFNNNSIITGYIKELLKDFNLPTCKVCRPGQDLDPGRLYIDGAHFVRKDVNTGNTNIVGHYVYGEKVLNVTKNLKIKTADYDSKTHEYLGDYLRFIRDFKGVDLMPLYNCFSNYEISNINFTPVIDLNTDDENYRYWAVPVKFGQTYTIALDSIRPYYITCLIEQGGEISKINKELVKCGITRNGSSFDKPFTFKVPSSVSGFKAWKYEPKLKLIIKLPKTNTSSITVIEGDYKYMAPVGDKAVCKVAYQDNDRNRYSESYIKSSLLNANDGTSYPFADKLIEYLLGGVVSPLEYIEKNIARLQTGLYKGSRKFAGTYDMWGPEIKESIFRELSNYINTNKTANNTTATYLIKLNGQTEKLIEGMRYCDKYFDCLGYGDKDVETMLGGN